MPSKSDSSAFSFSIDWAQPRVRPRHACSISSKKISIASGLLAIARSTSRQMTFPEPSQIELSGASRYRRGIPDSST